MRARVRVLLVLHLLTLLLGRSTLLLLAVDNSLAIQAGM